MTQKDLLSRLADAGEDAIQRLASVPGTDQVLGVVTSLRDRMDEMQRRLRGIDALERRVEELERRLDAMGGSGAASTTAQTGTDAPLPLSTSSSVGATAAAGGIAAQPEPPSARTGAMDAPLDTGASLGDMSGTAMPEPPAAADVGTTTEPPSAGDLGTTDPSGAGRPGTEDSPFSTGPSVGAQAQMSGTTPETPGMGDESDAAPGSSTSRSGGDSPG
jgi:hypothetical protein